MATASSPNPLRPHAAALCDAVRPRRGCGVFDLQRRRGGRYGQMGPGASSLPEMHMWRLQGLQHFLADVVVFLDLNFQTTSDLLQLGALQKAFWACSSAAKCVHFQQMFGKVVTFHTKKFGSMITMQHANMCKTCDIMSHVWPCLHELTRVRIDSGYVRIVSAKLRS